MSSTAEGKGASKNIDAGALPHDQLRLPSERGRVAVGGAEVIEASNTPPQRTSVEQA